MPTTGTAATALEIRRSYRASAEKVFLAWTQPEQLSRWLAPTDDFTLEVENDLRVGGRYRCRMTHASGNVHTAVGEYREVNAPSRLVFTWSWEENQDADGSVVTIDLAETDEGCELVLRHERLASEASRDHHAQGWAGCLARLEKAIVG